MQLTALRAAADTGRSAAEANLRDAHCVIN
jgi:hypothetical protein